MGTDIKKEKHFIVRVAGQYHALSEHGGAPALKLYDESFILRSQDAALSTVCKHLLSPRLKKKHSDFIRYRTHELMSIDLKNYTPNLDVLQMDIQDMNIQELSDFCILRKMTIDPFKYAKDDIFKIRALVAKAYAEKKQAEKDKRESKAAPENKEKSDLMAINDLEESTGTEININEHKATIARGVAIANAQPQLGPRESVVDPADEALPDIEPDPDPSLE